jgi:Mg-chelatase subunit ChlD
MNPELPPNPREELEQRLTALLLGELSAEESAALHRAMEQDGELAKLFARLHHTVSLVRETVASPAEPAAAPAAPLKLSAPRRDKLLAHFKTVSPKQFASEKRKLGPMFVALAALLVICALLAAISFPTVSRFSSRSMEVSAPAPALEFIPSVRGSGEVGELAALERVGDVVDRSALLAVNSGTSEAAGDEGMKRPMGVTSLPVRPATSIALPAPADNNGYWADDSSAGKDGKYPGDAMEQGRAFYRIAPGSGGGGGGGGGSVGEGRKASSDSLRTITADPEWAGALEKSTLPHSATNSFVARYAYAGIANTGSAPGGDNFRYALDFNRNAAIEPATGLPVAAPEAGAAQIPGQARAYDDLSGLAITPRPPVVLPKTELSDSELAIGGASSLVTNSTRAGQEGFYAGTYFGGTGGGGGGRAGFKDGDVTVRERAELEAANEVLAMKPPQINLKTKFAGTTQNDNRALGFDWYADKKVAQVESEFGRFGTAQDDQPTPELVLEGPTTTISERIAGRSRGSVPVLGDLPMVGRLAANSDQKGVAPASPVPDGGRIAPEPNVSSVDMFDAAVAPTQTATSAGSAINESVRRQRGSIVLPGLAPPAETRRVAADEKHLASDPLLTAGLARKEGLPVQAESAGRKLAETPADLQNNWAFVEKQKQLQDEIEVGRLLKRKINIEKIDLSLPKSSEVEIVETAQADSAPGQSAWGKLRSAVSGDVERAATIKLERDKSDIAGYSGSRDHNAYDPYFIQTESETIQSEAILGKVVAELKLDELWAKQKGTGAKLKTNEAIAMLRGRLDLRPVRNTTLVEIRAKSDKPEEAAQIANAVAQAYKGWRVDRGNRLVAAGAEELEKQSILQDEKIRQAKVELERLRTELNIPDADAGLIAADPTPIRKPSTNAPIPQPEIPTSENNFSTFSLNVSDVSFKLAAASLEKGQMPDAASIRSEEFINAFDYRDPEPAAGAPIAFAYERARYPFAHNRDLLRFSLKTAAAGRQAGRPLNIVLLLDNSGSMERADRVRIIREALRVLAEQLQPQDKLSVITFSRTARLIADGISGDKAGEVAEQVSGITPQGGTNLEDAMNLAYQTAARHYLANGINRVVLLTDGAANLGDVEPDSLKQKVEAQRQQGIALDCFGIGWEGLNDDLLEVLSRNGDGRYGFINSPEEAATDFVGQLAGALKVAASDVKVQVEFNPKRVTSYRQIGYAKHQLTKEQFRDNTVDAAEIAAQEAGNALYTVEVNPDGVGPLGTVRVRYKVPGTTDYREQAWDVPYTGNSPALEKASPAMRLAASASAFSEWLVASPFAGEVTPDALLGYLNGVPEVFGADSRPKKLEWMIRQAKSLEGK